MLFETGLPNWVLNSPVITLGTATAGADPGGDVGTRSRATSSGAQPGADVPTATQLILGIDGARPLYLLAAQLKLVDRYQGLVIAYSVTAIPSSIWTSRGTMTPSR